jgi:Zn-dependent peptidase ImmA (M78 family)
VIPKTIAQLRHDFGISVDPTRRGPVPLNRFYEELNLTHVALPGLTCGRVTEFLQAKRLTVEAVGEPDEKLAGFLFWSVEDGFAFVDANDILPRRRFTAAHELGHAVLHRDRMGRFIADTNKTLLETDDAQETNEREANQFAAELLMPEEICRARAEEIQRELKIERCPAVVLIHRLASELLVSREAMKYRLQSLRVCDE